MSRKKITVKEKEFRLPNGRIVRACFGDSYVSYLIHHRNDPMTVAGTDIRTMRWEEFFEDGRLTPMMYDYKPDGCATAPFVKNADKTSPFRIGMYLGVDDTFAEEPVASHISTGRIIYRKSIGDLMTLMYIVTEKSILIDRRGHEYKISVGAGVNHIYEYFRERIELEASEQMKQQIAHIGGLLTGSVSVSATSPRTVFGYIDHVLKDVG